MPATEQGNVASTVKGCKYYTSTKVWLEMKEKNDINNYFIIINKVKFYTVLLTPSLVEATAVDSTNMDSNSTTGQILHCL